MISTYKFSLLVALAAAGHLAACATRKNASDPVEDTAEEQEDTDQGEDAISDLDHPERANAFSTRALVNEARLPESQAIATCREDLATIGASALNHTAMRDAEEQAFNLVRENPNLYHWCFYITVVHLDIKLAKMRATLDVVAATFYESFRDLWILSRALDRYDEDNAEYFAYLRARYIQLSRDYFGRDLETQGPSAVDIEVAGKKRLTNTPPKPAARVETE